MTEETLRYKPAPGKFAAIMTERCPHCRQGKVFTHSVYSPKFQKMHSSCPVCAQDFEIEPGFYWGSMYISYALTVFIEVPIVIAMYNLLNDPDVWVYILGISITLVIISPFLFRLSRMLMLTLFANISYAPGRYIKKKAE